MIIEEKEKEPQLDAQALENLKKGKKGKGKSKKGGKKGAAGSRSTSKKDMIAKMPVNFWVKDFYKK